MRLAAEGEFDAVADLLVAVFTPIAKRMPPAVASRYLDEVRDVRGRSEATELLVVGTAGGALAGTVTFLPDSADDEHPWPAGGSVLRLLAVAPGARGAGMGRTLVQACVARASAQGRDFLGLHTSHVMEEACSLYERMGFIRAPAWDFDARTHYGSGAVIETELQGLAYVLPLD